MHRDTGTNSAPPTTGHPPIPGQQSSRGQEVLNTAAAAANADAAELA